MKHCRDVRAKMFAAFEHALEIEETLALEDHLRTCAACAEEARRARIVHEALAQTAGAPVARIDIERSVNAVREAIDRRSVVAPPRRRRWIAAAALIIALVIAARFVLVKQPETVSHEPQVVQQPQAREADTPPITEPGVDTRSAEVELAPLEPIDNARLEESRASVRAALVAMSPALAAGDVAGFVDGVDRASSDLARAGWPIVRIVERFTDDADASVATGAVRWLGRRGDALSLKRIERELFEPKRRDAAADALVDSLSKRDPEALAALLAKSVRAQQRPLDPAFALDLVAREKLEAAIPWIEEFARERAQRGDEALAQTAVDVVAGFDCVSALRALLRMRASNRFPTIIEPALETHLGRSTRAAVELARDRSSPRRAEELRTLNEALLEAPRASFVPVWIELAAAKELSRGDRRSAILLAGEHGRDADLEALTDLLRRFERNERDLKAAVLIALHTIGGERALESVLAATPKETRTRILELFLEADRVHKPETRLFELARRLEPLIAPLQL